MGDGKGIYKSSEDGTPTSFAPWEFIEAGTRKLLAKIAGIIRCLAKKETGL